MDKEQYLKEIDKVIAEGPYTDTWESLCTHQTPTWYKNDKFGIFIHWGLYSVPAFGNEWYARFVYGKYSAPYNYHVKKYGNLKDFGYKDFIPLFKAEKWDPKAWADLFKESGAKFVMPVAEHHDGFQMYDSDLSEWNAKKMGPKRDILGELKQTVENDGLKFCASSHRAEHWWIQVYTFKPYLKKFAAYYYNRAKEWGEEVAIDAKFDAYMHGSCVKDIERGQMATIQPDLWQNDTSVAKNSWGYTVGNEYKKSKDIICDLVDVVSKNGALLLNVGPKADGTIPTEDANILKEIGAWLKVNGEAIFDTTYWKVFGEGPTAIPEGRFSDQKREAFTTEDIRFTAKGDKLYITVLKWPKDGKIVIKSLKKDSSYLKAKIRNMEVLGYGVHPHFDVTDEALVVSTDITPKDDNPIVIKAQIL